MNGSTPEIESTNSSPEMLRILMDIKQTQAEQKVERKHDTESRTELKSMVKEVANEVKGITETIIVVKNDVENVSKKVGKWEKNKSDNDKILKRAAIGMIASGIGYFFYYVFTRAGLL